MLAPAPETGWRIEYLKQLRFQQIHDHHPFHGHIQK